ncbi:MAG: ABC transporter ATP-binding protein [Firmicutes bacterium]|nr:ABC transporter ATP-binding protein [Bacillota bacterium]
MPGIVLKNVSKKFGKVAAVNNVSLEIGDGEFVALLGPSGCGKTTILRMIAGLEEPDDGEITIGDEVVFSRRKGVFVPPGRRNVGMIFQNYALWPHLTVFSNIAFGLEIAGVPKDEIRRKVQAALEMMQIQGFENRYINEMSGGQQQRVAIARMLVTGPGVFLMDEPLSNLDAKLRLDMRAEIKRLHADLGRTCVYVTHDQVEALTLATKIAVLDKGTVQQFAEPMELYRVPANLFVAEFMGNPALNVLHGSVREGRLVVEGFGELEAPAGTLPTAAAGVIATLRPEDVLVYRTHEPGSVEARVHSVLPTGPEVIVRARCNRVTLTIRQSPESDVKPDEVIYVKPRQGAVNVYDKRSNTLICACV